MAPNTMGLTIRPMSCPSSNQRRLNGANNLGAVIVTKAIKPDKTAKLMTEVCPHPLKWA